MSEIKNKWDRIYSKTDAAVVPSACHVLTTYSHLLPAEGKALDLACGLGGNALYLAERGFDTLAIDISSVAIERLAPMHPLIDARCENIDGSSLEKSAFDIIVVSNFLDRPLCASIKDALAPGGLLFYQTFVVDKVDVNCGPGNKDYLLGTNELLRLFSSLTILAFSDQSVHGDCSKGLRNQSYLVALNG